MIKSIVFTILLLFFGCGLGYLNPFDIHTKEWWFATIIFNGGAGIVLGWNYSAIYKKIAEELENYKG